MSIIGEKGMIVFDDISKENKITYFPEYIEYRSDMNSNPLPIKNNGQNIDIDISKSPLLAECEHFLYCCKTRNTPITSGEEGLNVLKVLNSLQESLTHRKFIELKENISEYFSHESSVINNSAEIGKGTKPRHC